MTALVLSPGDTRELLVVDGLTRTQIVMYAGASGDFNPLHTDEIFATHVGYPSVFAHGLLTMGMTSRLLTTWFEPGRLISLGGRFTDQVWPGDSLTALATVERIEADDNGGRARIGLTTTNQHGATVMHGAAVARLGSPDDS